MDDYAEFRHLKYLLAIIEHKGVRAAAEALHITQPSLSRQAKEFQQHYKLNFYRKSKSGRIEITKTGHALPIIFRDLLEARDEAIAALEAIELGEAEVLRIGCSPLSTKRFARKRPNCKRLSFRRPESNSRTTIQRHFWRNCSMIGSMLQLSACR